MFSNLPKILASSILSIVLTFSFVSIPSLAQARTSLTGLPTASEACRGADCGLITGNQTLPQLATGIATILTFIIGSIAIIFMLYGAFLWMTDAEKGPEKGKKMIINAIIALIISVAAYGIVASILGFLNTTTVGGDGGGSSSASSATSSSASIISSSASVISSLPGSEQSSSSDPYDGLLPPDDDYDDDYDDTGY